MKNLKELENIETLIKTGNEVQARAELLLISLKDVSPIDLVYFCSLLRRVRLSVEVIKILQPLIYPKARSAQIATAEEKLEYASNLMLIGALSEAERILSSIDVKKYPIALIRLGFLEIVRWEYVKANHYFKSYTDHPQAERYNVFVAKVNHLQGLAYLQYTEEAWKLSQQLLQDLDPVQNRFLLAAVCEFTAEIFRQKKDFKKAMQFIEKGKALLIHSKSTDEFLLRKQEQIILGKLKDLKQIRQEAVQRKHYESIRDLDLHIALLGKNEKLLTEVFWKSKSLAYKKRTLQYAQENDLHINTDFFQLGKNKGIVFDVQSHALAGSVMLLKKGKAEARLLTSLLSEGYAPIKIFDLFAAVYPEEIFFPESSSDKIHQLLKRLRQFIQKAGWPIKIVCENDEYRVQIDGDFSLSSGKPFEEKWIKTLKKNVHMNYFNTKQAQQIWNCSPRTAFGRLDEMKKLGLIQVFGQTRATRFRFA